MNNRNHRSYVDYRRALLLGLAIAGPVLVAATLPAGSSATLVASGLAAPTAMAFAPDGRLFVCQQAGALRVIKNGALLPNPFVTVDTDSSGERGLLGIAFDPNFGSNGFVYVYYTANLLTPHNRVVRFRAKGDVAVPGTETLILQLDDLSASNHNGGALHFGYDGKLYIAVGENANGANSQTLSNLLGKILRINGDGTIPSDNPFFTSASGQNRAIWALGLRNPYTFAFHPRTGEIFINDVGQSTWEEINRGSAGANYGWPITEGPTNDPNFAAPVFVYDHSGGSTGGCAITGGAFYYSGAVQNPDSNIRYYYFADFCSGWIHAIDPHFINTPVEVATGIANPVDLQVSPDNTLHYLARGGGGQVYKFNYGTAPSPTAPPNNSFVNAEILSGAAGVITGRNTGATKETGEPNHAGDAGGRSVWYSWTAPLSGPVAFHTNGSDFDTLLAVYRGNSVNSLTAVGSNDDRVPSHLQSRVAFTATAGVVYRIAVDGFSGVGGKIRLGWGGKGGRTDFNLDGHGDLIWRHNGTGQSAVWLMNGSTKVGVGYLPNVTTSWQIAGTGDFNGDGRADIVWENNATGYRAIWLMNGTTRTESRFLPVVATQWKIAGTGDFNFDGQTDLVWQNNNTGQRLIWLMNGTTKDDQRPLPTAATRWEIVGTGDLNRDGQLDLVLQDNLSDARIVWFLNGTTKIGEGTLPPVANAWDIAGTGEFNGDGQADLIWQQSGTGQRVLWLMDGTTRLSTPSLGTVSPEWEIRNH